MFFSVQALRPPGHVTPDARMLTQRLFQPSRTVVVQKAQKINLMHLLCGWSMSNV